MTFNNPHQNFFIRFQKFINFFHLSLETAGQSQQLWRNHQERKKDY